MPKKAKNNGRRKAAPPARRGVHFAAGEVKIAQPLGAEPYTVAEGSALVSVALPAPLDTPAPYRVVGWSCNMQVIGDGQILHGAAATKTHTKWVSASEATRANAGFSQQVIDAPESSGTVKYAWTAWAKLDN